MRRTRAALRSLTALIVFGALLKLYDWVLSVCHRSNLDDRKRRLCITGIAGKLRHRLTGIGINILSDGLVVAKITFQDILCICDTFPYLVPS